MDFYFSYNKSTRNCCKGLKKKKKKSQVLQTYLMFNLTQTFLLLVLHLLDPCVVKLLAHGIGN